MTRIIKAIRPYLSATQEVPAHHAPVPQTRPVPAPKREGRESLAY
jgi:hypothetical protein